MGHWGIVADLGWATGDDKLASVGGANRNLWSAETRSLIRALEVHEGWVDAVEWSESGLYLASGGAEGTIILWGE